MLDFFAVITNGGLVLWYFQDAAAQQFNVSLAAINALISDVILQERGGQAAYSHKNLALKLRMDNELNLIYIAIYQKILQLSYVDKFLSDAQRKFRDLYKEPIEQGIFYQSFDFSDDYHRILRSAEEVSQIEKTFVSAPRSFEQSEKSKKKLDSMIDRKGMEEKLSKKALKKKEDKAAKVELVAAIEETSSSEDSPGQEDIRSGSSDSGDAKYDIAKKLAGLKKRGNTKVQKSKNEKTVKKGKEARTWDLDGKDSTCLDYSKSSSNGVTSNLRPDFLPDPSRIGTLRGNLQSVDVPAESDKKSGGVFSLFRGIVGGKLLNESDLGPVLEKLKDHLISKNVASEISEKLCQSVRAKLEGKYLSTFEGVTSLVRSTLTDALVLLLTPKRRLDILRDVTEARSTGRPYTITFCGVNGVGKSTNLAKISFWLIENNFRVLIAACDTFRAGAVEQLRTHTRHLNALHPAEQHGGKPMVELFEQGYGKDAADIARHAIDYAAKQQIDVVLVDTAGRMQDNEPLMRALAKLIHVNEPDLTMFVGEALVGNEAVDQLVKFNKALANYSSSAKEQMIDGIVLTKFDTIDDKVGAAISMTYITGQPIVFVGTGQTYTDLRSLDAKAVVASLMT